MPFEPQRAVAFVDEYRRWLEFQSTIEILKSPPDGYPMPPTDLLGGLDDIQAKAAASVYDSHYDFDVDVRELLTTAYDGHLSLGLCSTDIFQFRNDAPLVSISPNGTTIPKVYLKGMPTPPCYCGPAIYMLISVLMLNRRCRAQAHGSRSIRFVCHINQWR